MVLRILEDLIMLSEPVFQLVHVNAMSWGHGANKPTLSKQKQTSLKQKQKAHRLF